MSAEDRQPDTQAPTVAWAPLAQAAPAYGVSIDTLRRRMRRGELESRREVVPQGFRWLVPLPDAPQAASDPPGRAEHGAQGSDIITGHNHDTATLIELLRQELATRNQEISRLHDIIATQAQAISATSATVPDRVEDTLAPVETNQEPARSFLTRLRGLFGGP